MKRIIVNGHQEYFAEKIVKSLDKIILYDASYNDEKIGDLIFPNIKNIEDFKLEDGETWDDELSETEQIRLEMARSNAEMFEMMLNMLGGGM